MIVVTKNVKHVRSGGKLGKPRNQSRLGGTGYRVSSEVLLLGFIASGAPIRTRGMSRHVEAEAKNAVLCRTRFFGCGGTLELETYRLIETLLPISVIQGLSEFRTLQTFAEFFVQKLFEQWVPGGSLGSFLLCPLRGAGSPNGCRATGIIQRQNQLWFGQQMTQTDCWGRWIGLIAVIATTKASRE